jgi:hypothetical protein
LFCLWFLGRAFGVGSFNHSIFAKNYERVLSTDVAKLFFAEVYDLSRQAGWTGDEHFTADGTLIESWASLKSFVRKDGTDNQKVQAPRTKTQSTPPSISTAKSGATIPTAAPPMATACCIGK